MKNIGAVLNWEKRENQLVLSFKEGKAYIAITQNDFLRFTFSERNKFQERNNYVLESIPSYKEIVVKEDGNILKISADDFKIEIRTNQFGIKVISSNNDLVLSSDINFLSINENQKTIRFSLDEDEGIYGLGQDPMANLNLRDTERRVWHQYGHIERSGNNAVPFMISDKNYGLFLNSSYPSRFEIGKSVAPEYDRLGFLMAEFPKAWPNEAAENNPENIAIILDDDDLDIFIILRDKKDDIIKGLYELTGKASLLPKWAYGFIQCNCRYRSQDEMLEIATKMRTNKVPCDVLLIDWLWFREFGDLEWDERYWHDPQTMFEKLRKMGFKIMMAQHPFISPNSLTHKEFSELGFLNKTPPGERYTYDHTNPKAREYWWNKIKPFYKQGISGYWTDMGELEEHHIGTTSYMGQREQIHNIYMTLWIKGLYEGQRRDFNKRFFALNRASYPGIQKYGTVLWSGDIDASWQVMKEQVVIGQGVAISGIPFWSTDVGGFLTIDGYTPELFVRWFQWNVFCSILRVHGTRPGNEIWSFGQRAHEIARYFVVLRYKMLPLTYSLAYKLREEGSPIMRPMLMDFPEDKAAVDSIYQFMYGKSILVSPVTDKGQRSKITYLPDGTWYDFYKDEKYEGKQEIITASPIDIIPIFVKGGSIIPFTDANDMLYIPDEMTDNIILHVYPGNDCEFKLYDDDGTSFGYEDDEYVLTLIEYFESGSKRKLKINKSRGKLALNRNYEIKFHDIPQNYNIPNCDSEYDSEKKVLSIKNINLDSNKEYLLEFVVDSQNNSVKKNKNDFSEISFFTDTDLENEGRLSVYLSWENKNKKFEDYEIKATFKSNPFWSIEREDNSFHNSKLYSKQMLWDKEERVEKISSHGKILWSAIPVGKYMPVISKGEIIIEVYDGDELVKTQTETLNWGSGFLTRWSVLPGFKNINNEGMDIDFGPESDSNKPFYKYEDKDLYWIKDNLYEYNCFGYVELRRYTSFPGPTDEGINGITYLKSNAYCEEDKKVLLNISAEIKTKIWVNKKLVHISDDIIIDRTENEPIQLNKGRNEILIKSGVYIEKPYSGREWGFNLKFVDPETGLMDSNILYSY